LAAFARWKFETAEGLALQTLPADSAGEFYEEATRDRSASHHLQVKAALSLLYHVLLALVGVGGRTSWLGRRAI
jgi:hypothetical protein